jgi:general secretion pathway protein J
MRQSPHSNTRSAGTRGFTLIELMVALAVMALMATMGWQALGGMQQAMEVNRSHNDAVLTTEAGLNQWTADLDAVLELPQTRSLEWDGRALRLTRRSVQDGDGAIVVAWTRAEREGQARWLRWQSGPVQTREAWQAAWAAAAAWTQGAQGNMESTNIAMSKTSARETGLRQREVSVVALEGWQLFFFRGGAWSNPLSSAGAQDSSAIPDGVRLVLTLPPRQPLAGTVVRDWARNTLTGAVQ